VVVVEPEEEEGGGEEAKFGAFLIVWVERFRT
jgi:hypothetical protein